jgi:hypothetical protein
MPHASLRALGTVGAATLALFAIPAATAGQAQAVSPATDADSTAARAGSTGPARQLLLITGDRLLVPRGSPNTAVIQPPPGKPSGASLFDYTCTRSLKIPTEALPYLGRGLDPSLFQLADLERAERGGRLPVRLTYLGTRPAVPGVTVTRTGPGTADGYLTAASAQVFGAALRRQAAADHARGSYGSRGLFAHGLSISVAGAPAPAAQPHYPMRTLTVTGSNAAGRPDTGDLVIVVNLDNCNKLDLASSLNTFYHGIAKFSVPAGHYWAAAMFFGQRPGRLVILPQFSVENSATVHVSARAASSAITVKTPRPARLFSSAFNLLRSDNGFTAGVSWINLDGQVLRVSLVRHRPSIGQLHAYTQAELIPPTGLSAAYAYALDFPAPPGTIPPLHYTATPADLATVHERYFKDSNVSIFRGHPHLGSWVTLGGTPAEVAAGIYSGVVFDVHLPGTQIQYLSAAPHMLWQTAYLPYFLFATQTGPMRLYRPGPVAESWGADPLHPTPNTVLPGPGQPPAVPSASRAGNTLSLDITPFGDNQPGNLGSGYESDSCRDWRFSCQGTYALYQDGTEITHGDAAKRGTSDLLLQARLSPKPSLVTFVLTANRSGHKAYPLSAASKDVWTWRSQPEPNATVPAPWYCHKSGFPPVYTGRRCAVQDMTTLRYQVAGLSLSDSAKPGRQQIAIAASQIQLAPRTPLTQASVQVSFNGGKTWHPATVGRLSGGRFRAVFTAPASAEVTLRTHVAGADGVSVTETIDDAYRVAAS